VNDALKTTLGYMEDYLEVAESVLPVKISKLGRPLSDILKLDKQFQEFKSEYQKGDFAKIETFMESVTSKEPDALSYILSNKIQIEKTEKKSVLILDDLDRMDPEHIFRILNVFSAFHEQDDGNKFGFDKVILVGHTKNIENIFHHFYGKDTDFWGYVDKFYSNSIYEFSYSEILSGEIKKLIHLLGTHNGEVLQGFQNADYFLHGVMHHILYEASFVEKMPNLRQLLKLNQFSSAIRTECEYREKSNYRSRDEEMLNSISFVIKVLLQIFRTPQELIGVLKAIKISKQKDSVLDGFYLYCSKPMMLKVTGSEQRTGLVSWREYSLNTEIDTDGAHWDAATESKDARALFFDLLVSILERESYEE
jgi:hypothetical protein